MENFNIDDDIFEGAMMRKNALFDWCQKYDIPLITVMQKKESATETSYSSSVVSRNGELNSDMSAMVPLFDPERLLISGVGNAGDTAAAFTAMYMQCLMQSLSNAKASAAADEAIKSMQEGK